MLITLVPHPGPQFPSFFFFFLVSADSSSVSAFLAENPEFLEKYVLSHVEPATIRRWNNRRKKKDGEGANEGEYGIQMRKSFLVVD